MKVSIVTISMNQHAFLERALRSVLEQDYAVEYIVVDPGSTDGSREIIETYRDRIAHVLLEEDRGPADGLNNGFSLATGDIYAYVNADDALLPGAVHEAVGQLQANPEIDVVYGDGFLVDRDGSVIRVCESSPFDLRRFSYGHVMILQQATFIRRSAFERVGGFNVSNRVSWDGELILDVALSGGAVRHVARKWGAFTVYPETISRSAELTEQRKLESRRLFRKARGREWTKLDGLAARIVRVEKWLVSPATTLRRLRRALAGRPSLRLDAVRNAPVQIVREADGELIVGSRASVKA